MLCDIHDRYTRNLTNTTLQVTIAGGDHVTLVIRHAIHQTEK